MIIFLFALIPVTLPTQRLDSVRWFDCCLPDLETLEDLEAICEIRFVNPECEAYPRLRNPGSKMIYFADNAEKNKTTTQQKSIRRWEDVVIK